MDETKKPVPVEPRRTKADAQKEILDLMEKEEQEATKVLDKTEGPPLTEQQKESIVQVKIDAILNDLADGKLDAPQAKRRITEVLALDKFGQGVKTKKELLQEMKTYL